MKIMDKMNESRNMSMTVEGYLLSVQADAVKEAVLKGYFNPHCMIDRRHQHSAVSLFMPLPQFPALLLLPLLSRSLSLSVCMSVSIFICQSLCPTLSMSSSPSLYLSLLFRRISQISVYYDKIYLLEFVKIQTMSAVLYSASQ